jgi:hypothetical protein
VYNKNSPQIGGTGSKTRRNSIMDKKLTEVYHYFIMLTNSLASRVVKETVGLKLEIAGT